MTRQIFKGAIYLFTLLSAMLLLLLVGFLLLNSTSFFTEVSLFDFLLNGDWDVSTEPFSFGLFNILVANFAVAFLACIFSFFISLGVTIFICFFASAWLRHTLDWMIRILAGIPSIIYGFFALYTVVKILESGLKMSAGESVLAASLILSVMILPFFTSHLLQSVGLLKNFKTNSDALGVSTGYFIRKIIFRKSIKASILGFILAFSRAAGETMAVMMVIGNTPLFPHLLSKAQTIPSLIALEMGMSEAGSLHYHALIASGFILLIFIFMLNIFIFKFEKNNERF
ncbi:PstC family ABC transporter permease [Campylobacter concisus]|uniref:PstC family ABC transporter permease n=1 Tax=Campylobacter concisus TaxID=199 RepID=UPI000D33333B|nr:ABC transporter permease subunit [Campylobacter concisus]